MAERKKADEGGKMRVLFSAKEDKGNVVRAIKSWFFDKFWTSEIVFGIVNSIVH